MLLINILV